MVTQAGFSRLWVPCRVPIYPTWQGLWGPGFTAWGVRLGVRGSVMGFRSERGWGLVEGHGLWFRVGTPNPLC